MRQHLYEQDRSNPEHAFQYARGLHNFCLLALTFRTDWQDDNPRDVDLETMINTAVHICRDHAKFGDRRFILQYAWTLVVQAELSLLDAIQPVATMLPELSTATEGLNCLPNRDALQLARCYTTLAMLYHSKSAYEQARKEARSAIDLLTSHGENGWSTLDRSGALLYAIAKSILGDTESAKLAVRQAIRQGNNEHFRISQHLKMGMLQPLANDPEIIQLVESIRPPEPPVGDASIGRE